MNEEFKYMETSLLEKSVVRKIRIIVGDHHTSLII